MQLEEIKLIFKNAKPGDCIRIIYKKSLAAMQRDSICVIKKFITIRSQCGDYSDPGINAIEIKKSGKICLGTTDIRIDDDTINFYYEHVSILSDKELDSIIDNFRLKNNLTGKTKRWYKDRGLSCN